MLSLINPVQDATNGEYPLLVVETVHTRDVKGIVDVTDGIIEVAPSLIDLGVRLRTAGQPMTGDLWMLVFLWSVPSFATLIQASEVVAAKLAPSAKAAIKNTAFRLLVPMPYNPPPASGASGDMRHILEELRESFDKRPMDAPEPKFICGLHDELLVQDSRYDDFAQRAAAFLQHFVDKTKWRLLAAGRELGISPQHVLHFWKVDDIGLLPNVMHVLADLPGYAEIQSALTAEIQNLFVQARKNLPPIKPAHQQGHGQ